MAILGVKAKTLPTGQENVSIVLPTGQESVACIPRRRFVVNETKEKEGAERKSE